MNNLDLIKQYVNTGQAIGDYQVGKLPSNVLKSYLRKRLQAAEQDVLGKKDFVFAMEVQMPLYALLILAHDARSYVLVQAVETRQRPQFLWKRKRHKEKG